MANSVVARARDTGIALRDHGARTLDYYVPPSRRDELSQQTRSWMEQNPKLAAFVLTQAALLLPPLLTFVAFTTFIFTTTLTITLTAALTTTLALAALSAGAALLLLLPVLLFAAAFGSFLFVTGLITMLAVQKFSNDPRTEPIRARAKESAASAQAQIASAGQVVSDRVKDVSGGSVDLQAAAQNLGNANASASPATNGHPRRVPRMTATASDPLPADDPDNVAGVTAKEADLLHHVQEVRERERLHRTSASAAAGLTRNDASGTNEVHGRKSVPMTADDAKSHSAGRADIGDLGMRTGVAA